MSPFRKIAAGLAVAAVAMLATAAPASAHDQLVSSTPSDGEQLAAAPSEISMTFSGELIVLDSSMTGAVVLVVDEAGTDWADGDVTVSADTVTADLKPGMPVAGYQVRWQVVSEDGHPISGVIPFTIGDAEPMPIAGMGDSVDASSTGEATSSTSDQITEQSSGAVRVLLIGGCGAAVAVAVFLLFRFLRRPRAAAAASDIDRPAADDL
ncbi:copper resistance CopC family protein [Microbacterium sp.]|uniref:copper resistance CopC family protein n=1 Tax=Microbacterium sp. TaxID=51671 RepID=UPI003F9DD41C